MEILFLVELLVLTSLLLVHTEPARAAAGASIEADAILRASLLTDDSLVAARPAGRQLAARDPRRARGRDGRQPHSADGRPRLVHLAGNKVPTQAACTIDHSPRSAESIHS
jgi:hypothetical protein